MLTIRSITELRSELTDRGGLRGGAAVVGLVPTMGALHQGHVSLMRRARAECDVVVASLFVNPRQFNEAGDLAGYPRDEARDAAMAAAAGVDILFAPDATEIYPPGFVTTVSVAGPSAPLEGAHRGPVHFQGVATVVCKLLNIAGPSIAYFGAKDAQQAVVIRRMVADLEIPTRVTVCPTVRDADGLALSSRNALLTRQQRRRAPVLHRALLAVSEAIAHGEHDPRVAIAVGAALIVEAGLELEYLELVDPDTFQDLNRLTGEPALAVVAARLGSVRLIDNEAIPSS